jgi:antitoxin component of RelBE/YafQ-DinJ toxin-antitoxin module
MSQATAIQIDDKTKAKAEKALKRAGVSPQQAVQRLYRYIAD